jgi:mannose-1-phosphate guanylyltransferase
MLELCEPGRSMLEVTVQRVLPLCSADQVWIVTGEAIAGDVRTLLPQLPHENILAEPVGRNTLPCVGWAAIHIRRRNPQGVMVVLPADHSIRNTQAFLEVAHVAVAAARDGCLVTIGIKPTRAETGYGYIEVGDEHGPGVFHAVRFVEKPSSDVAQEYVQSGQYVWNSGMFFFTAEAILRAIKTHTPELYAGLQEIDAAIDAGQEAAVVSKVYEKLPAESIDYGIMERADRIMVCPARVGWSDVGSWSAAYDFRADQADPAGNVSLADLVAVDSHGCLAWTDPHKLVALVGVKDLVVVDTEDALLVCPREDSQRVREIVGALKRGERKEFL